MTPPVTLLTVCTGNVCRSPAAELLLRAALGTEEGVVVRSAGTAAPAGAHVSKPISALLRGRGIDPDEHRARWLTERDVRTADLILAMTREHRSRAVELFPAAVRRSFTLVEFARIAAAIPEDDVSGATVAERLRELIALAPRYRSAAGSDDVDDPYGQDEATNARVFAEISQAVATISAIAQGPLIGSPRLS